MYAPHWAWAYETVRLSCLAYRLSTLAEATFRESSIGS